ncbi:MAG: FlgD immunoglobulin-like domain containing protein [bacterium]
MALQPVQQNEMLEIPLPVFDLNGYRSPEADSGSQLAVSALNGKYGGDWRVFSWNHQTSTPHYMYGGGAKLATAITDAAQLEQVARQVLDENQAVFRAKLDDLALRSTPHALGKWVAHFQQTYHGLEVWQGLALVAFSDDGRLVLAGSDVHPNIDVDFLPGLSSAEAIDIACRDLPFNPATDSVESGQDLLVLPVPQAVNEVAYHLVYRVRVRTEDPLGVWVSHVDAHSGKIIWRYNDIHFDYDGTTDSEVRRGTYCNGDEHHPMPYLRINVDTVGTVISDENGTWIISGGSGSRAVNADLYGPYVDLNNYDGTVEGEFTGTAEEGVPLQVYFDDTNSRRDERDVFDGVNIVHDFFQQVAPGFAYANARISAYVNRSDFYCPGNAWWDGTINFCSAGGLYANTGEIQGVVQHEFGHGVQDAIIGWQGDQGLGEGNSDILAMLINEESICGRGFYAGNCVDGIRNADNTLIYPDDVIGVAIHAAGQVIAGFHWDAKEELQAAFGQETGTLMTATTWHYGRVLLTPTTQPDQVFATFFADDDDGDLTNGTPNYAAYCTGATNHNFDCPEILTGVHFTHAAIPYRGLNLLDYTVDADVVSLDKGVIDPASVYLHYRLDGGSFFDVLMTSAGGSLYTGLIPVQPYGSVVEYYISAEDDALNSGTSPTDAPTNLHYFEVDDSFTDEMELQTAWIAGALDDNAASGLWARLDPVGTEYSSLTVQPEDDHSDPGTICWITGNTPVGGGAGDNDVDSGKTTLYSPVFDLVGAESVTISYWKYYTNNRGNDPNNDTWYVDISNDGGANWTMVENTMTPTNAWVQMNLNLSTFFGTPGLVRLRFIADDSGSGSLVEAGVDDFSLVAVFGLSGAPDDDQLGVRHVTDLAQNSPNPFNPQTVISYSLQQAGPVSLKVFDVSGRLVKVLATGQLPAGSHTATWDGTNDRGRPVATGVYFYQLEADGQSFSRRMLLVK